MKYSLYLLFIFLTIGGCQFQREKFRYVGTRFKNTSYKKEDKELNYKIYWEELNQKNKYISITMQLKNRGNFELKIEPTQMVDDENNVLVLKQEYKKKYSLKPKENRNISMKFLIPIEYDISTIGSFRVLWNYKRGKRIYFKVTKFIRSQIEYIYKKRFYSDLYHCYHCYHRYHSPYRFNCKDRH